MSGPARWAEAGADEQSAEKAMQAFFARHPDIYSIDGKRKAELILRTHEIVAAWRNNRERGPSLETQRIRWAEAKKHAGALRKALQALQQSLGDDFDDILAGGIADEGFGRDAIERLQFIETRADRLVKNFAGKATDKRVDKFLVMACAEAWSIATERPATANQEKSPYYLFLLGVYQAYGLIGDDGKRLTAPSMNTLQQWLPKQT